MYRNCLPFRSSPPWFSIVSFLCNVLWKNFVGFFLLSIILYVLRFTASNYPFGIFKLFRKGIKFAKIGILIYRKRTWSIYVTPWYGWTLVHLALSNNYSLTYSIYLNMRVNALSSVILLSLSLCTYMSKTSVGKEMGAVCSHGDTDGLLTNVPSEFAICVIDT